MDSNEINNIIHAGVVFVIWLWIAIAMYFLLSPAIDAIFEGMINAPLGDTADEMTRHGPEIQQAVKIAFALGVATPSTWIIFWVFSAEPFMGIKRRY